MKIYNSVIKRNNCWLRQKSKGSVLASSSKSLPAPLIV